MILLFNLEGMNEPPGNFRPDTRKDKHGWMDGRTDGCVCQNFNLLTPELFFLILAHSVYKM